jgi:hypothetical protein
LFNAVPELFSNDASFFGDVITRLALAAPRGDSPSARADRRPIPVPTRSAFVCAARDAACPSSLPRVAFAPFPRARSLARAPSSTSPSVNSNARASSSFVVAVVVERGDDASSRCGFVHAHPMARRLRDATRRDAM